MEEVTRLFVAEANLDMLVLLWKLAWLTRRAHIQAYITEHLHLLAKEKRLPSATSFRALVLSYDTHLFRNRPGTNEQKFAYFTSLRHFPLMRYCMHYSVSARLAAKKAGRLGEPKLVDFFLQQANSWQQREAMLRGAAKEGHLDLIKKIRRTGCDWPDDICAYAAKGGQLATLQWLNVERGRPLCEQVCVRAARQGHLHVLQWALLNGAPYTVEVCESAALGGHLDILLWLKERKFSPSENISYFAALGGHVHILEWRIKREHPYTEELHYTALAKGHVAVLELGLRQGVPLPPRPYSHAVQAKQIAVLEWLRDKGYAFDAQTFAAAVLTDFLPVARWLHTNNCPWNEDACVNAVGSFALVQWLRANGCPWDERTYYNASQLWSKEEMLWLVENKCPGSENWSPHTVS